MWNFLERYEPVSTAARAKMEHGVSPDPQMRRLMTKTISAASGSR